ncbi:hypothetical protein MMC06_002190, partial [Schaereria dolodes]|nr:hypothetical protein [Schaereria dolodes]
DVGQSTALEPGPQAEADHASTSPSSSPKRGERSSSAHTQSSMTEPEDVHLANEEIHNDQVNQTPQEDNPSDAITNFDWDELEERYHERMEQCAKAEQDIFDEFQDWLKVKLVKNLLL